MAIPHLALKNLLGAGIRTWLNVIVLSFSFVAIIATQGLLEGMNDQVAQAMIDTEYGGGQYWQGSYDPYDPLTLKEAHGVVPPPIRAAIEKGDAAAVLIVQGSLYVHGRVRPVLIKGIDPGQTVIRLPSARLRPAPGEIPAIAGTRMAKSSGMGVGDFITLQWRDARGTFDAQDARIAEVFSTNVQSVDLNQVWIPLDTLRRFARMEDEATLIIIRPGSLLPRCT